MPAHGIKLLDANVWLALAFSDHAHHELAKSWFEQMPDESCAFCRVTQLALLRHLTNSNIMGAFVQTQQQAWSTYDKMAADARVMFIEENPETEMQFRSVTQRGSPSRQLWTDAYLSALAISSGIQLVTLDKHFPTGGNLDLLILKSNN